QVLSPFQKRLYLKNLLFLVALSALLFLITLYNRVRLSLVCDNTKAHNDTAVKGLKQKIFPQFSEEKIFAPLTAVSLCAILVAKTRVAVLGWGDKGATYDVQPKIKRPPQRTPCAAHVSERRSPRGDKRCLRRMSRNNARGEL
ncbi:MAG: hypothetical protein ACI4KA_00090, partial [Oscillospiraceae bacterium]